MACHDQLLSLKLTAHWHQHSGIAAAGAAQEKPPWPKLRIWAPQESSSRERGSQPSGAGLNPPNVAASSLTPAF